MRLDRPWVVVLGVLLAWPCAAQVPVVYSRCPRHGEPFSVEGPLTKDGGTTMATTTVRGADLYEPLPDTARSLSNFIAPCDLVYRDERGAERVLYDCLGPSTPASACAALDVSVSFDGKTAVFALFHGTLSPFRLYGNGRLFDPEADNVQAFGVDSPSKLLTSTDAHLVLVDLASGALTHLPAPPGTFNVGPTFLSNGRIAFSSAGRRDIYGPMPPYCTNTSGLSIQTYTVDPDGRNLELVSPHATAAELHGLQLTDGRLALSSWQQFGLLPYRHGNSFGGCGTTPNFFFIHTQNPDGSNAMALQGQHLADPTAQEHEYLGTQMAAHFFGQSSDGRVWSANYYRANNLGLGAIIGFPMPPLGQEGPTWAEADPVHMSAYRAPNEVQLATWATNADQYAQVTPAPALTVPGYADPLFYAGKLGHPSGVPGNQLLVTWGQGACSQNSGQLELNGMKAYQAQVHDNPGCDTGLYLTPALPPIVPLVPPGVPSPLTHPSQLVAVVNRPEYHEFLARPVVTYQAVHGLLAPPVIERAETVRDDALEPGTPFGVLASSSIIHRETHPRGPIAFLDGTAQASILGTDLVEYGDAELCGVRILATLANRKVESYWKSFSAVGERVAIIGEFPVRQFDDAGQPWVDALGDPETSFRVRFPADVPYLMQGIDCQGRTLNTDQTWQSLRPGEVKTCNGCHVHSAAATALPYGSTRAGRGLTSTARLGEGTVPLLTGGAGPGVTARQVGGFGYLVEFDRDVFPILQARCVSCHGATSPGGGLRLDLPRDWAKVQANTDDSTFARLVLDSAQAFVPAGLRYTSAVHGTALGKPNLSKYVRMLSARGSLLYWKALNARTDGHHDADRSDDVDFGADHPTAITADELGVLSRWIDTGCGQGPQFLDDGVWPTLHLVGIAADGGGLGELRVGTVDVGSGVDAGSLRVSLGLPDGGLGPSLAGAAAAAGVVRVPLAAPLTDPDLEVVAQVSDGDGHQTVVRRTVRFLLGLGTPAIVPPDAGPPPMGDGGAGDAGPSVDAGALDGGAGGPAGKAIGSCGCAVEPGLGALAVWLALVAWQRRRSGA